MKRFSLLAIIATLLLPMTVAATPGPGSLIKLSCPSGASATHPCKAVYFYGSDGRRHAFPNEKIYFTWYQDFAGVQTVSAAFMASIPLGANATYHPAAKMVKFQTLNDVYAVALGGELRWVKTEAVAQALYGNDWNTKIDDIDDTFFGDYRFGTEIAASNAYDKAAESAATTTIDDNLDATSRSISVATERGAFNVDLVKMQRSRWTMLTDVAAAQDCTNGCAAEPLLQYAEENGATIGIHGTYFCPPDYAECLNKTYSFHGPVYDSPTGAMRNSSDILVHEGPMIAAAQDGRLFFYHRTKEFGSVAAFETSKNAKLGAALANYPSLVENGGLVVESEARLDDDQRNTEATRGGIGYDDRFVYLVIAHSATVVDLASIMKTLGATYALNLDGGGSVALMYEGKYKVGPGRLLPNAILFKKK